MQWHLEKRKLSSLKEYEKNPRELSKDGYKQLRASLEKFGLVDKPIINRDDTVIGGHQRIKVLKDMGVKEVDCHVPDVQLTDKEVEEFCIRLNKAVGAWNWDCLANEWEPLDLLEYGFTQEELVDGLPSIDDVKEDKKDGEKCPHCGKKMKA